MDVANNLICEETTPTWTVLINQVNIASIFK